VTGLAVQLTQPAIRDIGSLPETVRSKIIESIISLREDPFPSPPLKKKLKGFGFPLYRLRIADYRVLYRIDEKDMTVMRVVDRKDLEKAIKRLKR
jgi:mRNA-degrading endonuclease RelE of RelBE toxin-antitoxin system